MLEAVSPLPAGFSERWEGFRVWRARQHYEHYSRRASALVVSTCTTPILGFLLAFVATKHQVVCGRRHAFAFSFGLGSLVIIVGTFTGLLTSLPRSGSGC